MRALLASLVTLLSPLAALAGTSVGLEPPVHNLPEPASLAVLGIGAGAVMIIRRFRK